MWFSACLNQEYTGCVSARRSVRGPLRQASSFRLQAPIGCFCWTKTQPKPPFFFFFFKKQRHFCALWRNRPFLVLITSYFIDDTLLFWWDGLTLMGLFVCNQHMNGIWIRVLFSRQAGMSFHSLVCARAKGLSSLSSILAKQRRRRVTTRIPLSQHHEILSLLV